jgi:hypothetical protein
VIWGKHKTLGEDFCIGILLKTTAAVSTTTTTIIIIIIIVCYKWLSLSTSSFEVHIQMLDIMWAVHLYLTISGKEVNHTVVIPLTVHTRTLAQCIQLFHRLCALCIYLNYIHVLHDPSK